MNDKIVILQRGGSAELSEMPLKWMTEHGMEPMRAKPGEWLFGLESRQDLKRYNRALGFWHLMLKNARRLACDSPLAYSDMVDQMQADYEFDLNEAINKKG